MISFDVEEDMAQQVDLIHDDENFIAIAKPSGVISMPCASASSGTAVHMAADYLYENMRHKEADGVLKFGIVHKLDKEMSGLILFAKHKKVNKILSKRFSNSEVTKKYIAIVHGQYNDSNQKEEDEYSVLSWPVFRKSSGKAAIAVTEKDMEKAKKATTRVRVLASNSTYSMLEVEVDTDRYHQIRVHLSHAGYPLVGDSEYCFTTKTMPSGAQIQAFSPSSKGGRNMGGLWLNKYDRAMLHSFSMKMTNPFSEEENLELYSLLPSDMKALAVDLVHSCGLGDRLWHLWQN